MKLNAQRIPLLVAMFLVMTACSLVGTSPESTQVQASPAASATPEELVPTVEGPTNTGVGPLMAWPMPAPTQEQIEDVRACDMEVLAEERYPMVTVSGNLLDSFDPQTDCDWAVLALAYANRLNWDAPLPEEVVENYSSLVKRNPAYSLATPLFYNYFGRVLLVSSPEMAEKEITDVTISYSWGGLGEGVRYDVELHEANIEPVVISNDFDTEPIDKSTVQALGTALTDLIPVDTRFQLLPCYDNYPEWIVELTFVDGEDLQISTDSNFIHFGGPWFTEIEGQVYLQNSIAFAVAVSNVIESLGLPLGEPAAMSCMGGEVFDLAFP